MVGKGPSGDWLPTRSANIVIWEIHIDKQPLPFVLNIWSVFLSNLGGLLRWILHISCDPDPVWSNWTPIPNDKLINCYLHLPTCVQRNGTYPNKHGWHQITWNAHEFTRVLSIRKWINWSHLYHFPWAGDLNLSEPSVFMFPPQKNTANIKTKYNKLRRFFCG